jgi:hypothetical protein
MKVGWYDVAAHLLLWRGLPQETFNGLHGGRSVYAWTQYMLRAPALWWMRYAPKDADAGDPACRIGSA